MKYLLLLCALTVAGCSTKTEYSQNGHRIYYETRPSWMGITTYIETDEDLPAESPHKIRAVEDGHGYYETEYIVSVSKTKLKKPWAKSGIEQKYVTRWMVLK